jgi:hypothetical protein
LLWVAEPRTGQVWVTEVLHLENPTEDVIDLARTPLELPVPEEAEELEVLRLDLEEGSEQRLGPKLLVSGRVPPGLVVIAFRYRQPAPLGRVRWERRYAFPIGAWRVLAPQDTLQAEGEGLAAGPPETFQEVTFATWSRTELAPDALLAARLSGVPMSQWVLLFPLAGFALVMAGVVIVFVRRRLRVRDADGTSVDGTAVTQPPSDLEPPPPSAGT